MTVYVFPGQGSQKLKMGAELFELYPQMVQQADDILGYSISELCQQGPLPKLAQTQYTQPAIFCVSCMMFENMTNKSPNYLIGHSLGEYSALYAAGVFSFETGLQLVKKRGELMSAIQGYGMAAIVGLTQSQVEDGLAQTTCKSVELANLNSPREFVVSGQKEDIIAVCKEFESKGASMCVPLPVSGAFHSSHMQPMQVEFASFLADFQFEKPQMTVIANCTAKAYQEDTIKDNLIQQIVSPVRWIETINTLKALGEVDFQEIGPGDKMIRLIRQF